MSAILDIRRLRARLKDGGNLIRDVSMQVQAGEVHGLVGESGAGKTMIARAILGILPESVRIIGGQIRFDDADLLVMHPSARRKLLGRQLAMIPQDPLTALNPSRRIVRQITDVLRHHLKLSRSESRAEALRLLQEVHIRDPEQVLERFPYELSGGMRQRVLIAIAFACKPKLIVADEPTTALDVTVQKQILRLIAEMKARHGTAMLFVTHDLSVVAQMCDRVTVLHSGMVVEDGTTSQILSSSAQPFTRALMAAMPRHDRPGEMLEPVPEHIQQELISRATTYDRSHR